METAIKNCKCKHSYQDKRYGKGKRLMNSTKANGGSYNCTVCEKNHK